MPVETYTRTTSHRLTYDIQYDRGEYFIQRDGKMKKAFPDALAAGMDPHEATADLMRRMAIADIESLNGMEE